MYNKFHSSLLADILSTLSTSPSKSSLKVKISVQRKLQKDTKDTNSIAQASISIYDQFRDIHLR